MTTAEGLLYLNAPDSDAAVVEDLINRASDYCESASVGANRPFVRTTVANLRLPGHWRPQLYLSAWPIDVTQPITVTLDGTTLTVWRSEADGAPSSFDVAVGCTRPGVPDHLLRAGGWCGASAYPVLVSYTGGFPSDAIPGDVKQTAYDVLETFWRAQMKRLTDVQSVSGTSGAPSVSFTPSLIPMRARHVLDAYRVAL